MHDKTLGCVLVENRNGPGCYLMGAMDNSLLQVRSQDGQEPLTGHGLWGHEHRPGLLPPPGALPGCPRACDRRCIVWVHEPRPGLLPGGRHGRLPPPGALEDSRKTELRLEAGSACCLWGALLEAVLKVCLWE